MTTPLRLRVALFALLPLAGCTYETDNHKTATGTTVEKPDPLIVFRAKLEKIKHNTGFCAETE